MEDNPNKDYKFETCVYRSENTYKRNVKICCNKFKEVEAYNCEQRDIFPLNSDHCENCSEYKVIEVS